MRIAVVGSHATGKSTLVAELARRMPTVTPVDEPYHSLAAAGHVFSDPPTISDFEILFDASVADLSRPRAPAVVFDRSPADYLAYLVALQPQQPLAERVAAAAASLETLDLIVYVPVERPDRIAGAELPRLRRRVDAVLHDMFVSQGWGWRCPHVEVSGTPSERAAQVARHMESVAPASPRLDHWAEPPNERRN
jgi:hypothetical protein